MLLFRLNKSKQAPKWGECIHCKHYTFLRTSVPFYVNWQLIPSNCIQLGLRMQKKKKNQFKKNDPNECTTIVVITRYCEIITTYCIKQICIWYCDAVCIWALGIIWLKSKPISMTPYMKKDVKGEKKAKSTMSLRNKHRELVSGSEKYLFFSFAVCSACCSLCKCKVFTVYPRKLHQSTQKCIDFLIYWHEKRI